MNISPLRTQVSFSARMDDKTRTMIRDLSKGNPKKTEFESEMDKAIKKSSLKDFGDENTTISVGKYVSSDGWESAWHAAGVVNTDINGKRVSVAIPSYGFLIHEREESSIINQLLNDKCYRQDMLKYIKEADVDRIKTLLAEKYIRSCSEELIKNADATTYDKIMNGEISFPEIKA